MPDLEGKTQELEQVSFSAEEETVPSLEELSEPPASHKVELKKQVSVVSNVPALKIDEGLEPTVPMPLGVPVPTSVADPKHQLHKEVPANFAETGLETEISFVLERQRIPLRALSALAEGEVMPLSGIDFKATLFLQDKAIGEGELILVDHRPAVQITKVFNV